MLNMEFKRCIEFRDMETLGRKRKSLPSESSGTEILTFCLCLVFLLLCLIYWCSHRVLIPHPAHYRNLGQSNYAFLISTEASWVNSDSHVMIC